MVAYHIFFRNYYSQGRQSQGYTLWRKAPQVKIGFVGIPVFSNAFLARDIPTNGVWNIDINDIPYAYVGSSSSRPLKLGDRPTATGHKLVKILPGDNGSTVSVYNSQGYPAFRPDPQYTAEVGTYNIVTEGDFTPNLNFVAGFSGNDGDGQARAFASFDISSLTSYSVRPTPNFYLGDFASQPGTLVDTSLARNYVEIDFAANPGQYNAIVTQNQNGTFEVKYVNSAVFAMATASADPPASASNVQLSQLKSQVTLLSDLVDAALGISTTNVTIGRYKCSFRWINDPTWPKQKTLMTLLATMMSERGYKVENSSWTPEEGALEVTHVPDVPVREVFSAWTISIIDLAAAKLNYAGYPNVERQAISPTAAFQSESVSLSPDSLILPQPQYKCSLEWLEGPSPPVQRTIARQLRYFLSKREYLTWEPEITDQGVSIEVYNWTHIDLDTVRADWQAAYDSLEFLKMYVYNPEVQPIYTPSGQLSIESSAAIKDGFANIVIPLPTFLGQLEWANDPSLETRSSIGNFIQHNLRSRGCTVMTSNDNGESFWSVFSHAIPYDIEQARKAWKYSTTLPMHLRQYLTNVRVDSLLQNEQSDVSITSFPPIDPTYVGQLTWLEGAPPQTRDAVIEILVKELKDRNYSIGQIEKTSPVLHLFFSHKQPSGLAFAKRDWIHAYKAVGNNLNMFISKPVCDPAITIQENGTDASSNVVLPVQTSYIGTLNWLEGPNESVKNSIIGQLVKGLLSLGAYVREVNDLETLDMLLIVFERTGSPDVPQATADWLAAYKSINDYQRMYTTNPRCELNGPVNTNEAVLPVVSDFLGGLRWLEGPNKPTKDNIIEQLKATLKEYGYDIRKAEIDFEEFLVLPFYSSHYKSLDQARADWLAAFDSITGFERMFITSPWCEEDHIYTISDDANGDANGSANDKGANIETTNEDAPAAPAATAPDAVPAREEESLESKKRRALALLEREGLVGFGNFV